MQTRCSTLVVASTLLVMALAFGACDEDPDFMHCPLSNSIIEVCEQQAGGAAVFTCVVEQHPFCVDAICASWEGSDPFCTRACATDTDCPSASTCREYLELRFCVPSSALPVEPAEEEPPVGS